MEISNGRVTVIIFVVFGRKKAMIMNPTIPPHTFYDIVMTEA
jgi:hypothetical protein